MLLLYITSGARKYYSIKNIGTTVVGITKQLNAVRDTQKVTQLLKNICKNKRQ